MISRISRYFGEIKKQLNKKCKTINNLNEGQLKDELVEYFNRIIDDHNNTKIPILNKLRTAKHDIGEHDIDEIEKILNEVKGFAKGFKDSEILIETLKDEFIYANKHIEELNKKYKEILKKTSVGDNLSLLDDFLEDKELDVSYLTDNIDKIKNLLEYDLINIKLKKNV